MTAGQTFHSRVEALDAEAAEESMRTLSPHVQFGRDADPRYRLQVDGDQNFSMIRLEIAGEIWASNEPDDTITIPYAVSGRLDWEVGDERGTGNRPWLQGVTRETSSRAGQMVELATFIKRDPLQAFARAFFGDEQFQLDFTAATALTTARADHFGTVLRLTHELVQSDGFEHPLMRASLFRQLAVNLFHTFPLRGDHTTRIRTAEARYARYRIAARFIDDHASLPITVEDAARAAGVGVRELEEIFRGHSLAGGVQAHLRNARLSAAHQDLVAGDPTLGDTVRDIALRWGFRSPSRFAALYREMYGVSPKWVLDR